MTKLELIIRCSRICTDHKHQLHNPNFCAETPIVAYI